MQNIFRRLHASQRGITGLETAIILIAFVVVASVFAYTVLSAGIFSSEKGKEAVHSGLKQARGSMEMVGGVIAKDTDSDGYVDKLIVTVSNALDGEPIDLTTTTDSDGDGLLSDESSKSHVVVVTYVDKNQRVEDIAWTRSQVGKGDGDELLERGEKFELTIDLTNIETGSNPLGRDSTFMIEIKTPSGSTLILERTTPSKIDAVMDLN
ncbi:MAG: archaellin/type IV pilin N-terminal domain-containing protein [Dehalococcoidia bacterium]